MTPYEAVYGKKANLESVFGIEDQNNVAGRIDGVIQEENLPNEIFESSNEATSSSNEATSSENEATSSENEALSSKKLSSNESSESHTVTLKENVDA